MRMTRKLDELKTSEKRFERILNASKDYIFSYDPVKGFTTVNDQLCKILQSTREKLIWHTYSSLGFPEALCAELDRLQETAEVTQTTVTAETEIRFQDGTVHQYEIVIDPIFDDKSRITEFGGIARDITGRKETERKLKKSEEQYRRITGAITDYLYTVLVRDGKATETIHNEACIAITGYSAGEFNADPYLWIRMVLPEDREMVSLHFLQILGDADLPPIEHRIVCKDGSIRWISDTTIPKHDENRKLVSYDGVIKDITEQKVAEEKLKNLLEEKELILKEVHHRIKNNMNTIVSLLSLQARTLKSKSAIIAREDAENRVRSMMMLYDKLYQSSRFSELSVSEYIGELMDEVISNFPNKNIVSAEKKIQEFSLEVKKIQPLGIIVNELLTNIMKYAFKGRAEGHIFLSATNAGGLVTVIVEDDGNGMPDSVSFENSTGFGLILVNGLTKQLNGTIRIERIAGTRIVLEFRV
jgi:PAS domain S-box-containing protein